MGFCILGSYAVNNSMFDVYVMFAAGFVGFLCKRCEVPLGPFVLALLLGNLCESTSAAPCPCLWGITAYS